MLHRNVRARAIRSTALLVMLGSAHQATAQDGTTQYATMAPIGQYLMTDRGEEMALARSAAPESIAREAGVLVLGRRGYETAARSTNGFACIVGRGWSAAADPDYWNPKVRVPMCLNAAAARTYLLRVTRITDLALRSPTRCST